MAKRQIKISVPEKIKINRNNCGYNGCAGGIYGLGLIGAAIYYIQTATGFWEGVLGVLKAIVWPAFLIHKLLGM
jgi:hypothetical protein